MQVLIIGGGVVGLSTAIGLAREGHAVQLLERERTGSRASWVAAGLLTPSTPWRYPRALIELCHASAALYPEFAADLLSHTGVDIELETAGMLYPVGPSHDAQRVGDETALRNELGFGVRLLDRAELDALQPGLGPTVQGAAWQQVSARVRPPRLLKALATRARQLGVSIHEHCAVAGIVARDGRVAGVRTERGQELGAETVVLAAGAWSSTHARSVGVGVDVRPVRGQMLLLRGEPGVLRPVVNDGDCYLVPRRDGRVLVGSTMEDVGFAAVTTDDALQRLRGLARELLPACEHMVEEDAWAGLRPGTPDRLPYLGPVASLPGLVLATGHYRNGILLAPITARIVADVLAGRRAAVELSPFAVRTIDPDASLLPSA